MKEILEGYLMLKIYYKRYKNEEIDYYTWDEYVVEYCLLSGLNRSLVLESLKY